MRNEAFEAKSIGRNVDAVSRFPRLKSTLFSAFAAAFCCWLIVFLRLELWRFNLKVPICYWGDALYFEVLVKSITEGKWVYHISRLGAPFGMDAIDFPLGCTLDFSIIKALSFFVHNPFLLLNLYWLLTLGLAAAFAAVFFRSLTVNPWSCTAFGALYGVIPFVFYRNISHLNLVHFIVPVAAILIIDTANGRTFDFVDWRRVWPRRAWRDLLVRVALCVGIGLTYIYWAFFACCLLCVSSLIGLIRFRKVNILLASASYVTIIGATAMLDIAPSLAYANKNGRNAEMAYKSPAETDIYGLRIRQMFTPIEAHPIPFMRMIRTRIISGHFLYDANESSSAALGTIGIVGLALLLCVNIARPTCTTLGDKRIALFAALAVATILIAETGGLGSLFNSLFVPDFRAYNRMSPFISLFAYGGLAVLADTFVRRLSPVVNAVGVVLLLVLGAFDQVPVTLFSNHKLEESQFYQDRQYIGELEGRLTPGTMIFQLPHTEFPMDPGRLQMLPYDNARAYLHSKTLRWTWGAFSGRHDNWTRITAELPPAEFLDAVVRADFGGVLLDRYGYVEPSMENYLASRVGADAIVDSGGRWVFFNLGSLGQKKVKRPLL